ncbi:MAG: hypothetical protein ICV77_06110 [Cyanobacteria bacterium Co-bin8]|nr:hypothetical protein [Cyanobacteria bacterium Co-bin8]
MTYRDRLYPWCIIRLLPHCQRITVARFRKRSAAEEHVKVLRRLIPSAIFVVLFEVEHEDVGSAAALQPNQGLPAAALGPVLAQITQAAQSLPEG